jgi:mannose-6-phosphate isomerase-like protein (cupin superfamily)
VNKVSIATAQHYVWGSGCDGWHLVNQPALSVIREKMPPGTAEVRHRHRHARQFFFVLAGAARFEAEGATFELLPGEGLEVPPGVPHSIRNEDRRDLEFLVVSQPHGHGDRESA